MTAVNYAIVANIRDFSLRNAVYRALQNDGSFSDDDIRNILKATLDGQGVTETEFLDLQTILKESKSISPQGKAMIDDFTKRNYRPAPKPVNQPSGQLTANFNIAEFACKDGTPVPSTYRSNALEVAKNLQVLRDTFGKPISINSAYRTASHNKAVGGETNSYHLTAKAADIVVSGHKPTAVKAMIEKLIKEGKMKQGGIGLYKSFVHYDIRGSAARWTK